MNTNFTTYLPIAKVDEERRLVSGYASTECKDSDGEVTDLAAIKKALPDYLEYGNVREMHKLNAIGVAAETNLDSKGLYLTAYIVDDAAWKKCIPCTMADGTVLPPVYKGFSIGGRKLEKKGNRITKLDLTEISIVDRPANPECRIDIAKGEKDLKAEMGGYLVKVRKEKKSIEAIIATRVSKMLKKSEAPPAAHDGLSLPAKPVEPVVKAEEKPAEASKLCKEHGKADCKVCAVEKAEAKPKGKYGDVAYADPGYQGDKKPRYPIDTEEHIRAAWNYIHKGKNAAKYSSEQAGHIKAKVASAWKSKVDKEGPPAAGEGTAKAATSVQVPFALEDDSFLTLKKAKAEAGPSLKKGLSSAGSLAYCFDSIRDVQRRLMLEGTREGGDKKDQVLAKQLGALSKQLADIIAQKASHEGAEALDMSDADDSYVNSSLTEGMNKMFQQNDGNDVAETTGDTIVDAISGLMKRAAMPTRKARLACATDNVQKSRKAAKAARAAIQEAHAMHKAAYIAKAAKGKGKPKDDEDEGEFDHAGAMEKLQKAYQELDKARTFGKAAEAQLEKLARSGQRGQEPGDAEEDIYTPPAGVKPLSMNDMAGAAPGTGRPTGLPPEYPVDGSTYAGKAAGLGDLAKFAKNGQVSAAVAQLIFEKARTEGELEALRRLPASVDGRQRPFAFDLTKVADVGKTMPPVELQKALFNGVDASAINGNDERAHVEASAKVIGNFLTSGHFGKSVFDGSFRGAAGSAR